MAEVGEVALVTCHNLRLKVYLSLFLHFLDYHLSKLTFCSIGEHHLVPERLPIFACLDFIRPLFRFVRLF